MGTHYLQIQLQVGIPQVGAAAGRLLCLDETTLSAAHANGPLVPLSSANVSVAFNPGGEMRLPTLQYLLTNAQLLALEQRRVGDLRLELQVRGFPPPQGRAHCGRAVGTDPGSHGGPGQRGYARGPGHQRPQVHPSRGRSADRHDRCPTLRHALIPGVSNRTHTTESCVLSPARGPVIMNDGH